jgi:hypothetical protein
MLPGEIRSQLPAISGQLELTAKVSGPLPRGPVDLEKLPLDVGLTLLLRGIDLSMPQPPLSLKGLSGRLKLVNHDKKQRLVKASIQLTAGQLIVDQTVQGKGMNILATATRADGEHILAGHLGFNQLASGRLLTKPLAGVKLEFDTRLLGKKELRLKKLGLLLPSLGLTLDFNGRLMRAPGTWDLSEWRMASKLKVGLQSKDPVLFPGGLIAQGKAGLWLSVESISSGIYSTRGKIEFKALSLAGERFGLTGMKGTVPVSQVVAVKPVPGLLARHLEGEEKAAPMAKKSLAYDEALLPMKGSQRSFAIGTARFKDLQFSDITGNLELAEGRLMLGSLRLGFLDGDVLADAQVTFAPPGTRRLGMSAEMSGVDLSGLGALALSGSSDVSGNLHLGLDISEKAVSASVNLTQIGRSTLQALLLAMDPEESNPGIMELRGYLKRYQVSPERVSLRIRHGLLGMEVVLKMGLTAKAAAKLISFFHGGMLSKYLGF